MKTFAEKAEVRKLLIRLKDEQPSETEVIQEVRIDFLHLLAELSGMPYLASRRLCFQWVRGLDYQQLELLYEDLMPTFKRLEKGDKGWALTGSILSYAKSRQRLMR